MLLKAKGAPSCSEILLSERNEGGSFYGVKYKGLRQRAKKTVAAYQKQHQEEQL